MRSGSLSCCRQWSRDPWGRPDRQFGAGSAIDVPAVRSLPSVRGSSRMTVPHLGSVHVPATVVRASAIEPPAGSVTASSTEPLAAWTSRQGLPPLSVLRQTLRSLKSALAGPSRSWSRNSSSKSSRFARTNAPASQSGKLRMRAAYSVSTEASRGSSLNPFTCSRARPFHSYRSRQLGARGSTVPGSNRQVHGGSARAANLV